jgi:AraC-like DNA-binding protein
LPSSLLLQSNTWVDRGTSLRLAEETARLAGDPLAAFRIVEMTQFSEYGAWGNAIANAPDLRRALTTASLGTHTVETGTVIRLREEGDRASVSFEFAGRLEADPRQHLQGGLTFLKKILDLAPESVPAVAHLPYDRSPSIDLDPWFTEGVRYRAERPFLEFDRGALKLALSPPGRNDGPAEDRVVRRVVQLIGKMLPVERPTVPKVAAILDIGPRTLLRRLHDWGVGFGELVDQYRFSLALQYVSSGVDQVTDIAYRLGYSDAAHFTRAFRRWTGMSPSEAMCDGAFLLEATPLVVAPGKAHDGVHASQILER